MAKLASGSVKLKKRRSNSQKIQAQSRIREKAYSLINQTGLKRREAQQIVYDRRRRRAQGA